MLPNATKRSAPHRKVHVSLPADIYDRVEARSTLAGAPFSTTLAELVRRALEREDQARLEEALRLDAEANAAFARDAGAVAARILSSGPASPEG